jgi:group I intron endonuclease
MIYYLYQYMNQINGKRYIGVTNNLVRRQREHASKWGKDYAFHNAVKKYGIEKFDFKVLAIFDRVDAAAYHEQAAIIKFGTLSPAGYNLRAGAPGTRYAGPFSAESRALMSKSMTGKSRGPQSLAHKQARSKALTGRHLSAEHRHNLSMACMGRPNPNKGKKLSPLSLDTRAAMTRGQLEHWQKFPPRRGFKQSDETKKKISIAGKGRVFSEAHKRKIGEGIHKFYATHGPQTKRREKATCPQK